jgi:signal peptidase
MNQEQTKKVTKVLKIVLNVFFYSVVVLLVLFSFANMKLKQKDDIANLFGKGFLTVLTDSMAGENQDSFTPEDIIFVTLLDDESRQDLEVGDIITYFSMSIPGLNVQGFITHRIVDKFSEGGETFLVTQGDKDNAPLDEPINIKDAIAVYNSKWVGAGNALKYLQTPTGFATFVILPVAIIVIVEAVFLVRTIIIVNNDKLKEKMISESSQSTFDVEAEKERIRKQILEEMKQQEEASKTKP